MPRMFVILAFLVSSKCCDEVVESYHLTQQFTHEEDTTSIWAFNWTWNELAKDQHNKTAGIQAAGTHSTDTISFNSNWSDTHETEMAFTSAWPLLITNNFSGAGTARDGLLQTATRQPPDKNESSTSRDDAHASMSLPIMDRRYEVDADGDNTTNTPKKDAKKPEPEECAVTEHRCVPDRNRDQGLASCSCQLHCKKPNKCCNKRTERCLSKRTPGDVLTQCIDNEVLVSSCDNDFNQHVFNEAKERDDNSTLHTFYSYTSYIDVQYGCTSGEDLLQSIPVTDTANSVHYRNILCAICNSAGDIRFWDGYLYCPLDLQFPAPRTPMSTVAKILRDTVSSKSRIASLQDHRCVALLKPKQGNSQRCFEVEPLSSKTSRPRTGIQITKPENPIYKYKPKFILSRLVFDEAKSSNFITASQVVSYQSLLKSFKKLVDITEINDQSVAIERCLQLKPYIHVCDECELHFQLLQCTPLVDNPIRKACYQSISYNYSAKSNYFTISVSPEPKMETIIEESLGHTFQLRMGLQYTFQKTRLVRGNVQLQVERLTNLVTSQVNLSRAASSLVCNMTSSHSLKGKYANQHLTNVYFDCEDENHNLTFDRAKLTNGDAQSDPKISQILKFAGASIQVLANATEYVMLPLIMEVSMCIVLNQIKTPNSFCTTIKMGWYVGRDNNGVIGNVPLDGVITIVCCALSIIGLLLRLAFQNIVPVYKSYPGKVQFNLCLSLLLSYCFFLIGGMVPDSTLECRIVGMLTHFALLSALFWMNVTAFEIWRTFRHWSNQVVSRGKTSLFVAGLYAIGVPAMIVLGAVMVEELDPDSDFSPEYGALNCWLNGGFAVAVYFVIPCSILSCSNVLFVGFTLRGLRRQRTAISEVKFSSSLTAINDTTIVVKISLLVGITWLLGLLAAVVDKRVLWIIFTVINASLGFFISLVLVCNKRVYLAVKAKCMCYNSDSVVSTQVKKH